MRAHSSAPVVVQWKRLYICAPDSNFCHACGCSVAEDAINNIDKVITDYFYRGFQYTAVIGLLKKHQRVDIHVKEHLN